MFLSRRREESLHRLLTKHTNCGKEEVSSLITPLRQHQETAETKHCATSSAHINTSKTTKSSFCFKQKIKIKGDNKRIMRSLKSGSKFSSSGEEAPVKKASRATPPGFRH